MTLEKRQNLMICSPHEIAWRMNFINSKDLILLAKKFKNSYGKYLLSLPKGFRHKKNTINKAAERSNIKLHLIFCSPDFRKNSL